ncbi:RNA polymerase sigma factor [Peribacillus sp. NPDC097675]|uniref:RNA polymerase sigma factor n=1 Tax=Peribacillus sp. NPDC097675 TaxID=3390618 RepID=UPI003D02C270
MDERFRESEGFSLIYHSFYKRIYYIALSIIKCPYLAEDITQETYLKAYTKLDTIKDSGKMGPWLACIATRTAIDFSRKQKRGSQVIQQEMIDWLESKPCRQYDGDDSMDLWVLKEDITNLLYKLSHKQREILLLKVNGGLKEREIATVLEIKQATVKINLYRARKQLRNELYLKGIA